MEKITELREQSSDRLENLISDLQEEIFNLRNELAMNRKLEKPHLIRGKRHTVAKAKTILSERRKDNHEK